MSQEERDTPGHPTQARGNAAGCPLASSAVPGAAAREVPASACQGSKVPSDGVPLGEQRELQGAPCCVLPRTALYHSPAALLHNADTRCVSLPCTGALCSPPLLSVHDVNKNCFVAS